MRGLVDQEGSFSYFFPLSVFSTNNQKSVLSSPDFPSVMCLNINCFHSFILIFFFLLFSSLCSLWLPPLRLPVPSLLAFCISSSWLPSLGCVWRVCNSISCSWRSLRASTHAKSTTICAATASPHWWWASLQP